MKKIESLTPEQKQKLIEFREEWLQIGLSTAKCSDRAAVEKAANAVRINYGQQAAPSMWFDGPATANMAVALMNGAAGANLWANLGANLGANLWANLGANLRDNLWANLRDNLRANLRDNLRDNLGANLWANLRDNLRRDGIQLQGCFYGSLESYWVAYYLFPHLHLRMMHDNKQMEQLGHWQVLCRAGWWIPVAGMNVFCELPSEIHREDGLLHNESGPAVLFRDGWEHYSISGVIVNKQIAMEPSSQTIEEIRGEQNEEVKRIRIERYGWARFLDEVNAEVLELRRNDIEGTDESLMRCDGMSVLVCACPSTGRIYGMEVPPEVESCQQAQNWLRNSESGFSIGAS